jgi:hypothetical protein
MLLFQFAKKSLLMDGNCQCLGLECPSDFGLMCGSGHTRSCVRLVSILIRALRVFIFEEDKCRKMHAVKGGKTSKYFLQLFNF